MKRYRCVFSYASGHTTIDIAAETGERAVDAAASAINTGDYDRVEVWDGDTLLVSRITARAWDAFGDAPPPAVAIVVAAPEPAAPRIAPLPPSLPRRVPNLFAASLRVLGLGGGKTRPQRAAARKS
jgi:hypothetical protein